MTFKKLADAGPPVNLSGPYLLDRIKRECIECDECGEPWHWTGKRWGSSSYLMRVGGKMISVRTVVYRIGDGRPVPKGRVITTLCTNGRCMNPALVARKPVQFVIKRASDAGKIHTPAARAKTAATQRAKNTRIRDMEHANSIRLDDRPVTVIAAEIGLSHQVVSLIKNNRLWVDHSSPFAGLMV